MNHPWWCRPPLKPRLLPYFIRLLLLFLLEILADPFVVRAQLPLVAVVRVIVIGIRACSPDKSTFINVPIIPLGGLVAVELAPRDS